MVFRYHPERFSLTRPYSRHVVNYFKNNALSDMPTMENLQEIGNIMLSKYNEALLQLPFVKRPSDSGLFSKEVTYAVHYATYVMNGRNIFHFEPDMVEKFRQTDIDEVPISALNFPYSSFYMSFGIQKDLDLWDKGYYVDGAYITVLPDTPIQITLSTVRTDTDYKDKTSWITSPDKYYYLPLDFKDKDMLISKVVDQALVEEIKSHDVSHLPDESGSYDIDGKNIVLIDNKHNSSEKEINDIRDGFNVFRESLRLVVNGLCYITSYQEDIEEKWPEDTPKLLLDRFNNADKASSKKKIKGELLSLGYTKVNFCGVSFKKNNISVVTESKEVSAHWRRGHWRNQACGQMLKERKLIWIMPVIVRKDKGDPDQGHIYNV